MLRMTVPTSGEGWSAQERFVRESVVSDQESVEGGKRTIGWVKVSKI